MTQNLIYIIPAIALIAILWSGRSLITRFLKKKEAPMPAKGNFLNSIKKADIVVALSFMLFPNHGVKQEETVFRNQGKHNSQSDSYKNLQANIFLPD